MLTPVHLLSWLLLTMMGKHDPFWSVRNFINSSNRNGNYLKIVVVYIVFFFCFYRSRNILDDFREAYFWLRQNTDDNARYVVAVDSSCRRVFSILVQPNVAVNMFISFMLRGVIYRVMSWWDYGYQIAGMANRTTLVDNNTWNNSHIALVWVFRSFSPV